MKKSIIAVLVLVMILLESSISFASSVSKLQEQLKNNEATIKSNKSQITEIELEQKDLLSQIEYLGSQINTLEKEIKTLNAKISTCDAEIKIKEKELEEKEIELNKQNEMLRTRISVMYKSGNISTLDLLFGSSDILDFLSRYYVMTQIAEFDKELLEKISKQKEEIAEIKVTLEQKRQSIINDRAVVKTKSTALASSKKVLSNKNSELESNKAVLNKSIDRLIEESNKITAEIIKLQGTQAYAGGEMAWPLPGYKTITSKYGMRMHPTLKVYKLHTGVDIAGSGCNGKPIVAANAGKVITATYNTGYGNMVIIDHGGGISTLYGHASKLAVSVGQVVKRGQTIAYVGSTGYSTGAHLHFEVRKNGATVNPLTYIQ